MTRRGVLALVVCAAPPALRIGELIELLQEDAWTVCVTATPTAATWIDREALARLTGYPVRVEWRMPGEPEPHPPADVVAVVPATFNMINKWALGINDTLALGVLNEALGNGVPVYAFPNVKTQLAAHPRYRLHLQQLRDAGVIATSLTGERVNQTVLSRLNA
ncbi:flavoprotein [Micromonospora sp. PPF5-17]|uniref:Flavoprotein n=1 Tax=Micromonospora solifontis TaxID=2487138 RepID=A0ABX9WF99_9ACTN|nr:flavoprotein [Micromonospora sp. PPF5-17B]NES37204.1 flavoprotein [Micromonospora solifontis]NES57159.1 flavoprotein [Micromonospora sp. PPF5-6]RNL98555.1 flavoprotein [Micromonospora solifontis]